MTSGDFCDGDGSHDIASRLHGAKTKSVPGGRRLKQRLQITIGPFTERTRRARIE